MYDVFHCRMFFFNLNAFIKATLKHVRDFDEVNVRDLKMIRTILPNVNYLATGVDIISTSLYREPITGHKGWIMLAVTHARAHKMAAAHSCARSERRSCTAPETSSFDFKLSLCMLID